MSRVIYTAPFHALDKIAFWSLLTTTAQYEPLTIITQCSQHHGYIHSLLQMSDISLSRVQLLSIDNYVLFQSGHVQHNVPGLLHVITKKHLHSLSTYFHTPGFVKDIISLLYHCHDYKIPFRELRHILGPRFSDLGEELATLLSKIQHSLKQLCPSHSLFNPAHYTPPTTVFIIGFVTSHLRHRQLIHPLITQSDTVSWFLPDHPTTQGALSQTLQWATSLQEPLTHIPYDLTNSPSVPENPTLYTIATPESAYQWVIQHIYDVHHSDKIPLHRFAIVTPKGTYYDKTLQQLAKRHTLSIQLPNQRPLSQTPLFQSIDTVIKMVNNGIHFKTLLALFMAPLIDKIKLPSGSSFVSVSILEWIGSEIDQHLEPKQWINDIHRLHNYLVSTSHKSNQINPRSNNPLIAELCQFLDQLSVLALLVKKGQSVNSADSLIQFLKQVESTFYLHPDQDKQTSLQYRHYYAFWDAIQVYITYHNTIFSTENMPSFWNAFIQFSAYRHVTDTEKDTGGIARYQIGDWIPSHYHSIYVLGTSAAVWSGSTPDISIIPLHARSQLELTTRYYNADIHSKVAFSQLRSLPQCTWIHSVTDHYGNPNLPSPLLLSWTQSPLDLQPNMVSNHKQSPTKNTHPSIARDHTFLNNKIHHDFKTKLSQFTFSATALQQYQDCPHQFFLEHVLGITAYSQQDETVKSTIWGQLIHTFLQQFFTAITDNDALNTWDHFNSTAITVFNHYQRPSFFWDLKRTLLFGSNDQQGLINALWSHLQTQPLPQTPSEFESTFLISLSNNETKLTIKGAIDLLLRDTTQSWITVVDYKTGKTIPNAKDIKTLRNIQLPTYLLAAKKMNTHSQIAGGILFQIRDESTINQNVVCCDTDAKKTIFSLGRKRPYTWDDFFFTTIETVLVQLKAHIDNAKFSYNFYPNPNMTPLKRQQSTCRYCGYRLVCRYSKRF